MLRSLVLALSLSLTVSFAAGSANSGAASPSPTPSSAAKTPQTMLPKQFDGWRLQDSIDVKDDPSAADQANAPVLKEYGFQHVEQAVYMREDGRKLTMKAASFADASGAYGAFTYYRVPEMQAEQIGTQGASLNNRVLFYAGSTLVDANFQRLSVMSAAELRDLATVLPQPEGNAKNLPPMLGYIPKDLAEAKYVMGPVTLDRLGSPLPTPAIDFNSGAEVVVGKYPANAGTATLMVISYPTPQIASAKLKQFEAMRQAPSQQQGSPTLMNVTPFFDRRSGPLVVIASGPISLGEAKRLLGAVSYDADVTWNENTYISPKDNLASFLFNVIILCCVVVGCALLGGLAFGGFRVLISRLFPNRVFDRPEDVEFISLHLDEEAPQGSVHR